MKKQFLPYYISRALLSIAFSIIIVGFDWKAIPLSLMVFAFFLFYLHSGWFQIDERNPFFPIRRDSHGQLVQRKALIIAIGIGMLMYFLLPFLPASLGLTSLSLNIVFAVAIIAYFAVQFLLFSKV
jgi:hypothetical protein